MTCKHIPVPGFKSCAACLERESERAAQKRALNQSLGFCSHCLNEPVPGTTMCEKHHRMNYQNLKKYRARHRQAA